MTPDEFLEREEFDQQIWWKLTGGQQRRLFEAAIAERDEARAALAAFTTHGMNDVRVLWASGRVCPECSHPLCVSYREAQASACENLGKYLQARKELDAALAACTGEWLCKRCNRVNPSQAGGTTLHRCPDCGEAMFPTSYELRRIEEVQGSLAAERERCAKIAADYWPYPQIPRGELDRPLGFYDGAYQHGNAIAAVILEGKP